MRVVSLGHEQQRDLRQRTSADVSIRQHTSAYVSIRQQSLGHEQQRDLANKVASRYEEERNGRQHLLRRAASVFALSLLALLALFGAQFACCTGTKVQILTLLTFS